MREIKFRAWTPISRTMYYMHKNEELSGFFCGFELLASQTRVLMQYTGLKDKNGKEIYEGDLLQFKYDSKREHLWQVIFKDGAFRRETISGWSNVKLMDDGLEYVSQRLQEFEVIGNIYENPELLGS